MCTAPQARKFWYLHTLKRLSLTPKLRHFVSNNHIFRLSRRRRTFVQWSKSHRWILFCPDPTTTTSFTSLFGHMVKKDFKSLSQLWDFKYIPREKKYYRSKFWHVKNPSMEGHRKGDNARFWSSDLQHNSGQNIPTFAPHTPKTHSTAWGAPCRARQDLVLCMPYDWLLHSNHEKKKSYVKEWR